MSTSSEQSGTTTASARLLPGGPVAETVLADIADRVAALRARGVTTLGDVVSGGNGTRFVLFRDNGRELLAALPAPRLVP